MLFHLPLRDRGFEYFDGQPALVGLQRELRGPLRQMLGWSSYLALSYYGLAQGPLGHRPNLDSERRGGDYRAGGLDLTDILAAGLRNLSATDALTDLPNRRMMMERLAQEHARYQRGGQVYTLVTMDLDHFKRINDTHGHTAGDQVLQGVAQSLMVSLRSSDTLARAGGEEFMLLMHTTTPLTTDAGALNVTMSLGVAEVFAHRQRSGRCI